MSDFRKDELGDCQTDSILRPRYGNDNFSTRGPRERAAQHRCRANFLITQCTKQFAKAIDPLVQDAVDRLIGLVTRADPGAARRDDGLHLRVGQHGVDCPTYFAGVVRNDLLLEHEMSTLRQEIDDGAPAAVGRFRTRVTDRHDTTSCLRECRLAMGDVTHGCDYSHLLANREASPYDRCVGRQSSRRRSGVASLLTACVLIVASMLPTARQSGLDADAQRWVDQTLADMTLDEKVGQLLVPGFYSVYTSSDSETYDRLTDLVHQYHVGGMLVFGARQPRPNVLLNPAYARNVLGQPMSAASLINRLQAIAQVPLLVTADFETGIGFRMSGGTTFPRAMAFGATGDPRLAYEAGRITATEARALGVHVNFAPVVDVNNNPRNPVINTRSFGEDPAQVGAIATAYLEGLKAGGMLATLKHFPGHGDTDVDSHLGLPLLLHPRERLDRLELPPFRAGIAAGVDGVMTAHIQLPSLEPAEATPATFSRRIVWDLLRLELGFDGLVFTDSMQMRAVAELAPPGEAAARAVAAGHDMVVHSPDNGAAFQGIRAAVERGEITEDRLDESVVRVLTAKARLGLHRNAKVSLDTLPLIVGTRANLAVASDISQRSITLLRDDRHNVPLRVPRSAEILYLSVLDYPSGWGVTAPSRTVIPELERRWPNVTAIELSDRTPVSEIELVRETAPRYDAIVAGVFVRAASLSGRMDLSGELADMLRRVARAAASSGQPFVTIFFGNPYVATFFDDLPATIVTYDFSDLAQESAVRALVGEQALGGRLPIALGEDFPVGHGLVREARRAP